MLAEPLRRPVRRAAMRPTLRLAADRGGHTNVLVVTTTVGVLHGVHGHTTHLGPAVALGLVLPVRGPGLQQGLLRTPAPRNLANHGAAGGGDDLLHARGELEARDPVVDVVRDNKGVRPRGARDRPAVP